MLKADIEQSTINRLNKLIAQLSHQAKQTDQNNLTNKAHRFLENNNLFSQQLFRTESDRFLLYVEEVARNLTQFSHLAAKSNNQTTEEFAKSSLQQIEQQISSIFNALQSNQSMHQAAQRNFNAKNKIRCKAAIASKQAQYKNIVQKVVQSSHQLYEKLTEHHEFERRLLAMITEREQKRSLCKTSEENKLSNEILTLHQRLGRCRKAISAIERDIKFAEKKN